MCVIICFRLQKFLFGKGKSVLDSDHVAVSQPNDSEKSTIEENKPAWEDPDDSDLK